MVFVSPAILVCTLTKLPNVGSWAALEVPLVVVRLKVFAEDKDTSPENLPVSILLPLTTAPKLTMLVVAKDATEIVRSLTPSVPPSAEPKIVKVSFSS